jgi:hypothetical protein
LNPEKIASSKKRKIKPLNSDEGEEQEHFLTLSKPFISSKINFEEKHIHHQQMSDLVESLIVHHKQPKKSVGSITDTGDSSSIFLEAYTSAQITKTEYKYGCSFDFLTPRTQSHYASLGASSTKSTLISEELSDLVFKLLFCSLSMTC